MELKKQNISNGMNLLIITQKVDINDDNLGFFHAWIEEFAKNIESVIVICLEKGKYNLPQNVKVFSLGKEERSRRSRAIHRLMYFCRFYKYIWRERKNYDAVFIHMNPEYAILGGIFWKFFHKKIYLWYTHKKVDFKLKLAEKLADKIFTASKESFRLSSEKVVLTGHGIDVEKFQILIPSTRDKFQTNSESQISAKPVCFKIITAGRITPSKNLDVLIKVCDILKKQNFDFNLNIAGAPVLEGDKIYFEKLKNLIKEKALDDRIKFLGKILYKDIAEFYQNGDLFINLSNTGSVDKAVLEAMASGLKVLTSNTAFKRILPDYCLTNDNAQEIAEKIIYLFSRDFKDNLRGYAVNHHNLRDLIKKITQLIS